MQTKLVTVAEMLAIEKEANTAGLSYGTMMENAGRNLAEVVEDVYGYLAEDGVCGLVGSGNNGGDTLVALAYLAEQGWPAVAVLIRPRSPNDPLIDRLVKKGGMVYQAWDDPGNQKLKAQITENAVLLDGVLGTGISLPLKPEVSETLMFVKKTIQGMIAPPMIVAVDCPSGVDCDSGEAAPEAIPADLTVTMAAVKQGLFRFPANFLVGDLKIVGIGLPVDRQELSAWEKVRTIVPDAEWVTGKMPDRPRDAHKGTFGAALVIAGSLNYTGAAWLAGQAAYRIGAGLVTLAVPEPLHVALAGQFPEATWLLLPEEGGFIDKDADEIILGNLDRVTAMLIGPGFGLSDVTTEFIKRLLSIRSRQRIGFNPKMNQNDQIEIVHLPPIVVDADGLKLLARIQDWPSRLPAFSILTPHPGEMCILTGLSIEEIQASRLETARHFSREWGQVVILKGAFTTIASPDGQAAVIPVATPALARAGTGDVLAGLVVGLRAQGVDPFAAAVSGAWIHAEAGWRAAEHLGNSASVLAGDVLNSVIQVISEELV